MKKRWLKFCCFIVGYNYTILENCSEISIKTVKKYISALFIISVIWGFIGYSFAERYVKLEMLGRVIVAIIMVFVIINIERQIILSIAKNKVASLFRVFIGILMAAIGSIIIDQIVFKDDIEKEKLTTIQTETDELLPKRTKLIDSNIKVYDSIIRVKEVKAEGLEIDINKNPEKPSYTWINVPNPSYIDSLEVSDDNKKMDRKYTKRNIPNPNIEIHVSLKKEISKYIDRKSKEEEKKISTRENIENELKETTGLLDELNILYGVISENWISIVFYLILFFFFLCLELFIVFNKLFDKTNDYDKTVLHQMKVKMQQLKDFSKSEDKDLNKLN